MKPLMLGFDGRGRPLRLADKERRTHAHVIGSSGSGKSKFLEHLMRQDLLRRQGFCLIDPHGTLYDSVMKWAAHETVDRKIIPLNLSKPDQVIGFNPFQKAPAGDISVQIDRRVTATCHAWGVTDTDETPTLARTLRLIYAVMLEHNLGLPQVRHLIDFNARGFRAPLIAALTTPLIQTEWEELQQMKARDWREETLSARNRLFKLLTSTTLDRVMGLPGHSINLAEVIEEGACLLVNLAPSDYLSHDNARVFGALLVNEFFECAMRRDTSVGDPQPYYLYLDEFQDFVSPAIAAMLDQIRKFGIFLVLAHQRFGQLDEDTIDAVLTNCKIKSVFGGLRVESARMMAEELFIGKLDPMKVKAAIYQTKFWPKYGRDQVYTHGTSHGTSSSHGTTTGEAHSSAEGSFSAAGSSTAYYSDWFDLPQASATSSESSSSGTSSMSGSSSSSAESFTEGESTTESDSVADVPIFIPVPFQELSSVQFMPIEEQLHQMTAALKEQFPRHCFIKIQQQETQPLLVPKVEDPDLSEENLLWYRDYQLRQRQALSAADVDRQLVQQEKNFLETAGQIIDLTPAEETPNPGMADAPAEHIEAETASEAATVDPPPQTGQRKKRKAAAPNIFDDLLNNP